MRLWKDAVISTRYSQGCHFRCVRPSKADLGEIGSEIQPRQGVNLLILINAINSMLFGHYIPLSLVAGFLKRGCLLLCCHVARKGTTLLIKRNSIQLSKW